jgi:uncharacterized membrane protein
VPFGSKGQTFGVANAWPGVKADHGLRRSQAQPRIAHRRRGARPPPGDERLVHSVRGMAVLAPGKARRMVTALRPFVLSGIALGIAVAGFLDGIVFHQLLQWHHMLSATHWSTKTVCGLEANTWADGAFHLGCLAVMILGVLLLGRDIERVGTRPPPRGLIGALLVGVGIFNVAEGVIDHVILGIHHVRGGAAPYRLGHRLLGRVRNRRRGWRLADQLREQSVTIQRFPG